MIPFTADAARAVASVGEAGVIARIRGWLGEGVSPPPPRGIGDDCAVLPGAREGARLVTVDSVVWGRHFDASVPARAAGAKLVRRNLSDIAAMGGAPADAVLALVCGGDVALEWLGAFFEGVGAACRAFGVALCGGDVAGAPPGFFSASLALTGFARRPLLRGGGRAGDVLLVTGALGGSLLGRHVDFAPRLEEGRWLAARPQVRAGMDLTDGLAKDARALLPAGVDACLDLEKVPVSAAAFELAGGRREAALAHALGDGEDYELLILAAADALDTLCADWAASFPALALTPIGRLVETPPGGAGGRLLDAATGEPLCANLRGFDHFA
ncbi:MAG: thiamine-phosphate kinase [Puniceicoccales bacterium]|jgi:thiamine-monophosphate kinase|nr:thiamine-phosphate kinase [Puniceicoccales bacterium]